MPKIVSGFDMGAPVPIDDRMICKTTTERDNIPEGVRYEHMEVICRDTGKKYRLEGGITNDCWVDKDTITEEMFSEVVKTKLNKAHIHKNNEELDKVAEGDVEKWNSKTGVSVKIRGTTDLSLIQSEDPKYNGKSFDVTDVEVGDAFIITEDCSGWGGLVEARNGDMVISIGNNASYYGNWIVISGRDAVKIIEDGLKMAVNRGSDDYFGAEGNIVVVGGPSHIVDSGVNISAVATKDNVEEAKRYADKAIAGIVNSAPEALNTLEELAKALGNDENFFVTVLNELVKKANAEQVAKDIEAATSDKEDKKNKGVANGYAGLDEENQVPDEHLQNYLKVKTTELRQGNILNMETRTEGYKFGTQGNVVEASGYAIFDYERVVGGTTYSFWQRYGAASSEACFYNKDKELVKTFIGTGSNIYLAPENAYYIRVVGTVGHTSEERQPRLCVGSVDLGYSEYLNEEVTIYKEYAEKSTFESKITELQQGNILYGKKWTACGDSFTAGPNTGTFEDGLYAGKNKVYPFFIGRRNNMAIVNEAISGSTMTAGDNSANPFSGTRYTAIATDSDYITIMLGINDDNYHKQMPIGTIDDADNTTFYGAWNVVLEYLIEHHPFAKIGIIVPNGCTSDYAAAIRAVSRKWGIPYLDIASDYQVPLLHRVNEKTEVCARAKELRAANFAISEADTHPNAACHEYESTFIEAWLRTL